MAKPKTMRVKASTSALRHADAKKRLKAAARAAGCTVEELVDLVVDSDAIARPPTAAAKDGVTATLTLRELGKRMHGELVKVFAPKRAEWFGSLLPAQQIALVAALADEGYRPEVIAKDLGISAVKVRGIFNEYADTVGQQVTQVRLSTIAGRVQIASEAAMEGLKAAEDWKGYFNVAKDMVKILQSLGIVDSAIHRVEVTHKLDENTRSDIDAMLDLEAKKRRRLAEIAQSQGQQLDPVPRITLEEGEQ